MRFTVKRKLQKNEPPFMTTSPVAQANLSLLKNMHDSVLMIDKINSICLLRWKGRVDIETATELLTLGAAAVQLNGFTKILVDRRGLIEFDHEARIWIDRWLKTKAKSSSQSVDKLAVINSEDSLGNLFNNMFNATVGLAMPRIAMKKFHNGARAINWLTA